MRLRTTVYRAHNPRWSFAPLSGAGAARYGGRFNPTGMEALYTSRRFETAWLEAQQGFAFKAQPLTLIAYDVDCDDVADLTQAATCAGLGVSGNDLGCAWEDLVSRGIDPPSWQITRRLYNDGTVAIIVPSYAPGANEDDINVVFCGLMYQPPPEQDGIRSIMPHGRGFRISR
jgi:RES domain-containing protein